ncbi:MAG TPA: HAMP domain-containing sensor histidine kinase, partial [Longimicrobiales bacterium]
VQQDQLDRIENNASKLALIPDTAYQPGLDDALHAFGANVARGDSVALAPLERPEQARLHALWQPVRAQAESLEAAVRNVGRDTAAADSLRTARLDTLLHSVSELRLQSHRLGDASRTVIRNRLERSALTEHQAEQMSIAVAVGAVLLSIVVAAWIVRSIAGPLRQLSQATHRVAEGRFDYRFDRPRDAQFAQLAEDFSRMTRRLAELDRMKQQFLTKASHDLKTPLASMQETSRVLLDGLAGPLTPDQQRLLRLGLESGDRLSSMIAKILDLSAIEAGMRGGEHLPHDLRDLARKAAELATPALSQRGITVRCRFPDAPVLAECDPDGVMRVLDNLLENAGRLSAEGEAVHVAAGSVPRDEFAADRLTGVAGGGPLALLVVEDRGPGVPDSEKTRIFEPFYQAANGSRARRGGVGLGLAICREIVSAHGGRIWVEDAPERGSRFIVALPAAVTASSTMPG